MSGVKITAKTVAGEHIMHSLVSNEDAETTRIQRIFFRKAFERTYGENPYSMTVTFKSKILEQAMGVIKLQEGIENQLKEAGLFKDKDYDVEVLA